LESFGGRRRDSMPRRYSPEVRRQVVELACAGTKVSQLAATFGMTDATGHPRARQRLVDGQLDNQQPWGRWLSAVSSAAAGKLKIESTDLATPGINFVAGLVPDDIRMVTLHTNSGSSLTVPVHDNVYAVSLNDGVASILLEH
jgi:transposase-like protein